MPELDEKYADELSATPKVITEEIKWRIRGSSWRFKARVLAPQLNEVLELRGVVGKTNHSFTLLYNRIPIRRYGIHSKHTTPEGETIHGPHKHTWNPRDSDRPAYVPDDIDFDADLNEQFLQFLAEQNITLVEDYQYVMFEAGE
jgi:hypothetical protein